MALSAIGSKRLMWGSDYPHLESQWPHTKEKLRELMNEISEDDVVAMVSGNAVEAYGVDPTRLAPVVEQIGPTVGEIVSA